MLLCDACRDSQWAVERYVDGLLVYCRGSLKVADTSEGLIFRECGKAFRLPPWFEFMPTARR